MFLSMTCKFCELTAQKMTIILGNNDIQGNVYIVFFGDEEKLAKFWKDSKSKKFPYKIIDADLFFQLSGTNLPAVYFINKGTIEKKAGYRDLFDNDVTDFFGGK